MHVAYIRKKKHAYNFLVGKPEVKNNLEDLDVNGKIILEWILKK
jgi:hypothetical protein